jgi:hypothetical protein
MWVPENIAKKQIYGLLFGKVITRKLIQDAIKNVLLKQHPFTFTIPQFLKYTSKHDFIGLKKFMTFNKLPLFLATSAAILPLFWHFCLHYRR